MERRPIGARCARFVDFLIERVNFDADYMEVLCPNRKCGDVDLDAIAVTASDESSASTIIAA